MAQQAAKAARDAELKEVAGELPHRGRHAGEVVPDPDQGGRTPGARGRRDGDARRGSRARRSSRPARASSCARWQARSRSASSGSPPPRSSLAGLQLGWVAPTEGKQVALCVLAFTVPLQFTASIFGFLARDGVAATGMGLLSGIWAATGLVLLTGTAGSDEQRARPLPPHRGRRDVGARLRGCGRQARARRSCSPRPASGSCSRASTRSQAPRRGSTSPGSSG